MMIVPGFLAKHGQLVIDHMTEFFFEVPES
jgi:hypothetical protein